MTGCYTNFLRLTGLKTGHYTIFLGPKGARLRRRPLQNLVLHRLLHILIRLYRRRQLLQRLKVG
jgi:hypothetical protein